MSFETRALPLWPETRLPKDGVLFFYDPTSDGEYRFLPEQLGDAGPGILVGRHTFRFRTRAEADADGNGGEVLEEFDFNNLYTYATGLVEFWRDVPTDLSEVPRGQELVAAFDQNPNAKKGWRTSGGAAGKAGQVGLKWVFPTDYAAIGVYEFREDRAVKAGQVRFATDEQGLFFAQALLNMEPSVPRPIRGLTTNYWKPAKQPEPGTVDYGILLGRQVDGAQALKLGAASSLQGGSYIVLDKWNKASGGVALFPISKKAFFPFGIIAVGNEIKPVVANLAELTYEEFPDYIARLSSGGNSMVDLLDLTEAQLNEVLALTYTDCEAALADTPAWSRPGQWFDAKYNGKKCHFYCGRETFDPAAPSGTTGSGPVWKYFILLG